MKTKPKTKLVPSPTFDPNIITSCSKIHSKHQLADLFRKPHEKLLCQLLWLISKAFSYCHTSFIHVFTVLHQRNINLWWTILVRSLRTSSQRVVGSLKICLLEMSRPCGLKYNMLVSYHLKSSVGWRMLAAQLIKVSTHPINSYPYIICCHFIFWYHHIILHLIAFFLFFKFTL